MNSYKIYVYAICKNEEAFVDRWMDAVGKADGVIVTDTGSTDQTVRRLRDRGAAVYEEKIDPWRFDAARNIALSHVPEDADICVSNDLDEVFEPGWRQKLEEVWQPEHTRARYLFTWSRKPDGSPEKQFSMEKIHARHGFSWVHPVHEVLRYSGEKPDKTVWVPGLVLHHFPDTSKPRGQYLPLLEMSVKENPDDDRARFWLGREYMYNRKYDECIRTLTQYLKMPSAVWEEERSAAMRFIASCYEARGSLAEARGWMFRAAAECPAVREPYLQMAKSGYLKSDWPLVFFAVTRALGVTRKSGSYLTEPAAWGYSLYDYGAIAAYRLGMYAQAMEYARKALSLAPDNERLQSNLKLIQRKEEQSRFPDREAKA